MDFDPATVIKAPKGQGCPKCDGFVYHADQGREKRARLAFLHFSHFAEWPLCSESACLSSEQVLGKSAPKRQLAALQTPNPEGF